MIETRRLKDVIFIQAIEIIINDEADEIIKELDSLKNNYQNNLEQMKGSDNEFAFEFVQLLYYKCLR